MRRHLSYSNVMSTIAVFLALGGGTAYAVDEWNGSNIQDETLTGADIRGSAPTLQQDAVDGTLETWDIKNGSIFPVDIADDSLGPSEIAPLSAGDLQSNSVNGGHVVADALDGFDVQNLTGADVVNDSLDGFDIHNLSGGDLIDGSVGPEDLAPGTRGLTRVASRTSPAASLRRGERESVVARCPAGWLAVGGGYNHSNTQHPEDIAVSYDDIWARDGWRVAARHVGGVGAPRITLQARVNCVQ